MGPNFMEYNRFVFGINREISEAVSSPPASPVVRPATPLLRERQVSESTVETSPLSSQMSDTANEQFSEGQWLLSVISEGEVPGHQIDPGTI